MALKTELERFWKRYAECCTISEEMRCWFVVRSERSLLRVAALELTSVNSVGALSLPGRTRRLL